MNKSCHEYQLDLSLRIDGELPPEREIELDSHLQNCSACREFWNELNRQKTLFKLLMENELTPLSSSIDWEQFQNTLLSKLEPTEGPALNSKENKKRIYRTFSLFSVLEFIRAKPLLVGAALSVLFLLTALSIPYLEKKPDVGDDCIVERVVSRPKTKVAVLHTQVEDTGNPMTVIVISEDDIEGKD